MLEVNVGKERRLRGPSYVAGASLDFLGVVISRAPDPLDKRTSLAMHCANGISSPGLVIDGRLAILLLPLLCIVGRGLFCVGVGSKEDPVPA